MLINLQPAILFHRHSDINGTDKDEIMNIENLVLRTWRRRTKYQIKIKTSLNFRHKRVFFLILLAGDFIFEVSTANKEVLYVLAAKT